MFLRLYRIISTLAAASLVGLPTHAAEQSGTLTLREALSRALTRSPELAAFSWDIRSAEARILQASLRPNPELSLEAENLGGTGDFNGVRQTETTLQIGQLVELGGKRAARIREAALGRDLARWDYETKRVEVFTATAEAFAELLGTQRRVALAEEALKLAEDVVPVIQKRVEAGKAASVEVTRSQVAVASARIELEQARRALAIARQKLASQWGATKANFGSASGDLDTLPAVPSFAVLFARLDENPRLARWPSDIAKREATLRLQQAQAVPDVTISAAPRHIAESNDVTGVVGFSIPLPISNRNQGAILEARHQISKAAEEKRNAEAQLANELNEAFQTLSRAADEIRILKDNVLPGAQSAVEQITTGYQAGRFSYLEVIDARRTLVSARLQYLQALADYHKAIARIEGLTGAVPVAHALPKPAFR